MYKLILAAALATLVGFSIYKMSVNTPALRDDVDRQMFNQWLMQNGKSYGNDDEKEYRYGNFKQNIVKVEENTSTDYELGLNEFADLNEVEFAAKYTGLVEDDLLSSEEKNYVELDIEAPRSKDWVSARKVNPVKNQGGCGSCWAFSAVAALETRAAIDTGSLPNFSEQSLVDCGREFGTNGCNGGLMDPAFRWAAKYGMPSQSAYPYTGRDGRCRIRGQKTTKVNRSYHDVPRNNNAQLVNAISQQVVSVAIAANAIMLYKRGVFTNWGCGTGLNHGVAAVGYGVDSATGKMFYKVRNSWGSGWGEGGYIRFERRNSGTGMCGITLNASYPTN